MKTNTILHTGRAAALLALAAMSHAPALAQDATSTRTPFAFTFSAVDGTKPLDCTSQLTGFGADKADTVGLNDLRFYVSDIVFIAEDGTSLPAKLDDNEFQLNQPAGSVALVDLTGSEEGSCAPGSIQFGEGTARVNATVTGNSPMAAAKEVSFRIGVPQELMQAVIANTTAEAAPSPLGEMYWNWAMGYRHFVLNHTVDTVDGKHGDGYIHIGSAGCGPAEANALTDRARCDYVNTPLVRLPLAKPGALSIGVDIRAILADLAFKAPVYDMTTFAVIGEQEGTACHSSPGQPDCAKVFATFGLSQETGDAASTANKVFKVLE